MSDTGPGGGMGAAELEEILTRIAHQILDRGIGSTCPADSWGGCTTVCVEICPESAGRVLAAGAARIGVAHPVASGLGGLAGTIDHTLLKADATLEQIDVLCAEALEHRFAAVCVNGIHVRRCAEILAGSSVAVCTVVGFPLGASAPEVKAYEAQRAIEDGASEVDMVLSIGALKSGDDRFVQLDVATVAEACHSHGASLKVILEMCLLNEEQKVRACRLAKAGGADYVKTSTGFSSGGATVEDVALMRRVVGPDLGIKAAGGVKNADDARALVKAGATRIGASASVAIAQG